MCKFTVVSANPGIDRTLFVNTDFKPKKVNRYGGELITQGSKGANLAAVLHRCGASCRYVSFTGGEAGKIAEEFFKKESLENSLIPCKAGVRTNYKIAAPNGVTEVNAKGGPIEISEQNELKKAVFVQKSDVLVLSGSLASGISADFYAELVAEAKGKGMFTAVDTAGEPLKKALQAGADLIKPNTDELAELLCMPLDTDPGLLAELFCELYPGVQLVLTCGKKGVVYSDGDALIAVPGKRVKAIGTVGAGDSFLAAFLAARFQEEKNPLEALDFANAAAAAKVILPGTSLPTREEMLAMLKK